jgi:hypothetical protein
MSLQSSMSGHDILKAGLHSNLERVPVLMSSALITVDKFPSKYKYMKLCLKDLLISHSMGKDQHILILTTTCSPLS